MKPEEIKARKEWLKSMHLRPVYLVEGDGGMQVNEENGELKVYIAIAPTNARGNLGNRRGRQSQQLCLIPVSNRELTRYVAYQNRGCIFPWDDIETATEVCFKSKVAEKREELKNMYGEYKDEE